MATLPEIVCAADWRVQFTHLDQPGGTAQPLTDCAMEIRDASTVEGNSVVQFGPSEDLKPGRLDFDSTTNVLTASIAASLTDDLLEFAGRPLYWDLFATVNGERRRIGAGQASIVANVTAVSP